MVAPPIRGHRRCPLCLERTTTIFIRRTPPRRRTRPGRRCNGTPGAVRRPAAEDRCLVVASADIFFDHRLTNEHPFPTMWLCSRFRAESTYRVARRHKPVPSWARFHFELPSPRGSWCRNNSVLLTPQMIYTERSMSSSTSRPISPLCRLTSCARACSRSNGPAPCCKVARTGCIPNSRNAPAAIGPSTCITSCDPTAA